MTGWGALVVSAALAVVTVGAWAAAGPVFDRFGLAPAAGVFAFGVAALFLAALVVLGPAE